jgi:hypothetical protein
MAAVPKAACIGASRSSQVKFRRLRALRRYEIHGLMVTFPVPQSCALVIAARFCIVMPTE